MSNVSDAELADGMSEPEFVKASVKEEKNDEQLHLHDIEHLSEDIKNKISSAGLSGPTFVDDLFKTFLAKKMEDIESEHKKQKKKKSSKGKKDGEDGSKSRKHKRKKKHKSKSSRKKSRSKVSSECEPDSKLDCGSSKDSDIAGKSDHGSNSGSRSSRHSKLDRGLEKSCHESNSASKNSPLSKDDHHGSKDDHHGSKDDHHGSKDDHHGSKDDHRGSKDDHHGSKDDRHGSKDDRHGSKDDHHGSNAGSNAGRYSKSDQRSGKDCHDSNAAHGRDADHISGEDFHHEKKSVIEDSNANNLGTSFGIEITEPIQTINCKIESTVDITDATVFEIKTENEGWVFAKPLLDDFKDVEERISKSDVGDAECQHNDSHKVDSALSQMDHSESCKTGDSGEHSGFKKELPAPCDDLNPVNCPEDSEAGIFQIITRVWNTEKEHCNRLNFGTYGVQDAGLVGNEKLTSEYKKGSEYHENRAEDQIQSNALDSKPLSSQETDSFSTDQSKDPNRQSKDHSRKSKDRNKHSSSRTRDHLGKSSEQSDKAAKSKSSSERRHDTGMSLDCDRKVKDRGDRSKDRKSQFKDNCRRSKDHEKSSRDHDSRSKDREKRSKDHENTSKDLSDHSKDHGKRSGDRDSQSKDLQRQSRDRDNQSKADDIYSRDHNRQSQDHGQQSREQPKKRSSEKDDDKTKSSSEKNRDRSRSADHGHRSTDRDLSSKDHDRSSKDRDRSSKDRDRSSKDHDRSSKDRDRSSKDRHRQSRDRITHASQVDRAHSRSKRSPSDRRRDRSRSVEILDRSKDRSKSVDRSKRKRSRENSINDGDSSGARRMRRLKSKKQKHRKRREKSVEIIEDDDEMESPEASEKLTERLLKRLNTSIKRGQELKGEKDARLDPTMSSGVGTEEPEEVGCGDEETKEGFGMKLDAEVFVCGATCEVFSSAAAVSGVDVSGVAVSSVGVSGGNCLGVSSTAVPAQVQGAVAETGGQGEKAAASMTTTKPGLGKMKKTLMKMGIRLTETSMAIISSGVMMEAEQKVELEDEGHGLCGESTVKSGGSEDQRLVGDVLPGDATPKQLDKNLSTETISKTDLDKTVVKGDGWSKQDPDDGGRSSGQKEMNLKSESRKRRHSRSRERGAKKGRDNRGRDTSPAKKSESRTKDTDRRSHARSRKSRSRSKNRRHKSRSRSNDQRRKSKSRERRRASRSQSGDRRQSRRHGRSRSPVAEKSQVDLRLKIDKARLREIAIKKVYGNVVKGGIGPVFDMKPEEVVAFRSGGKSVEELTDFCKRIAEKEKNQLGESSSPEVERPESEDEDNMPFTANAFKARELTNSIVLNIRNSRPLPVLSSQEKIAKAAELRTQFPVSSGTQHRAKEWVPVEKTQQTAGAVPGPSTGNPPPPGSVDQPVVEDKVFPDPPSQQIDVGQVVSERLSALRKLQTNPHDVQALGNVFKAQQQMQQWAASKQLPGQFVGTTGLSILPQKDIFNHNPRNQAWVKKDTFTRAPPIDSGIGKMLLQRMGWKEGEGLGKNNEGMKLPLMVDIKMDRKGLTTEAENGRRGHPGIVAAAPIRFDFSGKHPVSALNEICTKRKWNMPNFILMEEAGPSHSRTFRFKVEVNNVEYVPLTTSSTKKTAKLEAATVCLQQLGLLPRS